MSEPRQTGTGFGPPDLPDDERSVHARARGLEAPTITGGEDPDPEKGVREERFYVRLLLIMVALIVGLTIVLTLIANYITATS